MNFKDFTMADIALAKEAYRQGKNVTNFLRELKTTNHNTPEIIEIAYELQAGSYIKAVEEAPQLCEPYFNEVTEILKNHVSNEDTLLDIGCGELTTISNIINRLANPPKATYAFDISWSRIYLGIQYQKKVCASKNSLLIPFVAEISKIPLLDKSINITTSSHALEPNGNNLDNLICELFRVTKDKLVLFEPFYELNTPEGKERMDKLGYIKKLESLVSKNGGKVLEIIKINNIFNQLNPTYCFVITPPLTSISDTKLKLHSDSLFSIPGTNHPLAKNENLFFSESTGLCFPVIKGIPILRPSSGIFAAALTKL